MGLAPPGRATGGHRRPGHGGRPGDHSVHDLAAALQRKFKGDREGMARAQMQLYKERGINPAAGCVPLLIQLPVLFGMYSAMSQLATMGLTLDQVTARSIESSQVVYAAERHQDPLPFNQFVLTRFNVVPTDNGPITLDVSQEQSGVWHQGQPLLSAVQGITLSPTSGPGNPNPPNTESGKASIFLRAGIFDSSGTFERNVAFTPGAPYVVEVWVNAANVNADAARAAVTFDPAQIQVVDIETPALEDVALH